jgi:MFS family permease
MVSVALYGGSVVGGRLGHRYGDRWDRRRAMISADLIRAAMLATLALLPGRAQTFWLYPAVILVGVGQSVFGASLSAATPVLAGSRTQSVNSAMTGLRGIAFVIGMGLAAVAVPVIGYRGVFASDASSYALSAIVLLILRLRTREATSKTAARTSDATAVWPQLVMAGLAGLIVLRGLDAFASSSQQIGLPILGSQLMPKDATLVPGAVWSSWAFGLVTGSFVLRPLSKKIIRDAPQRVFCVATILMSAGFVGIFWLPGLWPRLLFGVLAGVGDSLSEITYKQAMQSLPDHRRGRAFGFSQMFVSTGFLGGLLLTSVALRASFLSWWVLVFHSVPFVMALGMVVLSGRRARVQEQAT